MFKKITSVLVVSLLIISLASAQEKCTRYGGFSRVKALGMNQFVIDPDNIKYNPAFISKYNNFLWGDIGDNAGPSFGDNSAEQFMGVNFQIFKGLDVGLILSRTDSRSLYPGISQIDPGFLLSTIGVTSLAMENNLEIMGAMDFDKLTLGLGIAYVSASNESKPATGSSTKESVSQIGINAGLIFDIASNMNLDASLTLIMPSYTLEPPTGTKTEASQTMLGVNARSFIGMTSKMTFVPVVEFATMSGTYKTTTEVDLPSYTELGVGFGIQYKVGDFMFIGGPSFQMSSVTIAAVPNSSPELTDTYTYFPNWNLGAEWYATDWLIARMGYYSMTGSFSNESAATSTTKDEFISTVNSQGKVTLGLGLRFGGFGLDATVNSDVVRQGLGNIGGGPTFAHISASYAF